MAHLSEMISSCTCVLVCFAMGKYFVPYCNTGYRSCKEKFSLFTPPQDQARLEAWRRAIPRKDHVLQRTDRVCEKHFAPHFISKAWSAEINGHVLMSVSRRAGLSKDAVPSIFEGAPSYLSKKIRSPRKQSRRHACGAASSASTGGTSSGTSSRFQAEQQAATAPNSDAKVNENSDVVAASDPATSPFDEMFCAASTLCFPTPSWGVHRIDLEGYRDLVFHDASLLRASDGSCVFQQKNCACEM
ncbi:hypothetical protein HPB51_024485 [Rhipicephalus microplus]|uniref:THAP-type domain-containing protein n=1 Tax=Rhipicephalus microplus TaxID=6941 RepID=A0A9J6F6E9_RHIMP|nr:hypothetical protein HPB51_024485 [Rhipicephalus microplus]